LLSPCVPNPDRRAEYLLRLEDPAQALLEGELRLTGLAPEPGELELQMVERFAFVTLGEPLLAGPLEALGTAGPLPVERLAPYRWRVTKGDERELRLRWRTPLTHRQHPEVRGRDEYEYPYVAQDHGMLSTSTALFLPVLDPFPEVEIRFELPQGWAVHAPWPEDPASVFHPPGRRALERNLVAVGAWSTRGIEAAGSRVTLGFAPGQEPLEEYAAVLIAPILRAELELFDFQPFEHYLVLFGEPDGRLGMGGSPKEGSMTCYVSRALADEANVHRIAHLVAHEFFHTWQAARFDAPDELRFVVEGWTDYYALLLPAELGVTLWSDFEEALETALTHWRADPMASELSLAEAGGPRFFRDLRAQRFVYEAGLALAALAELEVRRARPGARLADVLRRLTNDPRWSRGGRAPGLGDLEAALASELGPRRARELVEIATARRPPDLTRAFAEAGAPLTWKEAPVPRVLKGGLEDRRLLSLDPFGLAQLLGLRAGDEILAIDGQRIGSSSELRAAWRRIGASVELEIRRDGERSRITAEVPSILAADLDPIPWREGGGERR